MSINDNITAGIWIPDEMWLKVFTYLGFADLLLCSSVSRRLTLLSEDISLSQPSKLASKIFLKLLTQDEFKEFAHDENSHFRRRRLFFLRGKKISTKEGHKEKAHNLKITAQMIKIFPKDIRCLTLHADQLRDSDIEYFSSFSQLNKLKLIRCCHLTNKAVIYLQKIKPLNTLVLQGAENLTSGVIPFIPRDIKVLELGQCQLRDNMMQFFPKKLENLTLHYCVGFTSYGLQLLPKSIKSLALMSSEISQIESEFFSDERSDILFQHLYC